MFKRLCNAKRCWTYAEWLKSAKSLSCVSLRRKKHSLKCLRFMFQTEARNHLKLPHWNYSQFENHHLTIQFPTTLLSLQSWRFNSPINKKQQHFYMVRQLKFWNEIEIFFWNLSRLFMMQKWLLQKKDWKQFQMNKFSCLREKLNFVVLFVRSSRMCRLMRWRLNWKTVYSDFG